MRNIKLIIAAAALTALLASCEKDFTVKTGDTPVEFLSSTMDVELNSVYNFIPIQMTANSELSSLATFELVSGTIVMKEDGSTRDVVDGTDVIFTSKEIYIGKYDPQVDTTSLPNNNIEFRIPKYLEYQSISLTLRLTGENLGSITELVWTASAPAEASMAGSWAFGNMILTITEDEDGNFGVQSPFINGYTWSATRANNQLTLSLEGPDVDMREQGVCTVIFCAYHEHTDGNTYLWPDEACILEFSEDGTTVTATNGIFHGFQSGSSWYNWPGSVVAAGTVGTRQ